jgi:hypothetical protein
LTSFINKLYLINKKLDCYYKTKEILGYNPYKTLIDDFFETFNFKSSSNNNNYKNIENEKNIFCSENENENNLEAKQNYINLDFNSYFNLKFNYTIYLLPGNSHNLFSNSSNGNSNCSKDMEKTFIPNNNNPNSINNNSNNKILNPTNHNGSLTSAKRQSQNLEVSLNENSATNNSNICNTGFLSRYIAKKDYIYRMLVANLWSNIDFETTEDEYIYAKRFQMLKENLNFYIREAENIFNLYLFKIELIRPPYMIFNLNRALTNTANDVNDSVEFLFWKNLKIVRKEDEYAKKKGANESNLITIE